MPTPTIRQRFLDISGEFMHVLSANDDGTAVAALSLKWTQLNADLRTASSAGLLDDDTVALAHATASEIAILSDSLTGERASTQDLTTELTKDMENMFAELTLSDATNSPISHASPPEPSLPPYIEPAYKWLLKHLHNPYPKKEIKEKIADETGSSLERIKDWFVDARRRMGWTALWREEFGRKRANLVDAATRYYVHPNPKDPLPVHLHGKFVQMEAFAHDMYASKLVPSALSNKLMAAVKDLTPELQEKARLERLQKLHAQREAAQRGGYPSPAPSGASSPISDPGASTSYASRKRSFSESSDDDHESLNKRSRTDDGAFALPSPPYSGPSSPTGRKRRLSEAGAPGAKRRRTAPNRAVSDPTVVTLAGTPDLLADWFSSDHQGDTSIFEPGQLLDVNLFNPSEFDFTEEPVPAQPVVQTTTCHRRLSSIPSVSMSLRMPNSSTG
ncbi:hypothetical protein B0H12DRAFT_765591 [Mycena haematopus]|nr:hypothetical protein B0H12DRAFT_765591 [Mycena haematopus]